ncbi:DUF1453 domain-containing protein [Streptomyces sp. NPDC046860]|uniref:DUF1453 domain-containing protein n=1 Tax=Streptomyces sp. NPDC046860 TaxID=3154495 RepID=UPI0033DFA8D6
MSGFVDALVVVAVAVLVIARQFRTHAIDAERRWWLAPAILTVMALRGPGIVDSHHRVESLGLLVAEVAVGLATGAGWAWTTRIWRAPDGVVWSRGTKTTAAVWAGGIVLRGGLFALGHAMGVRQDSAALMLGLAATLLVRGGITAWRARLPAYLPAPAPTYGDGTPSASAPPAPVARPAWKERV